MIRKILKPDYFSQKDDFYRLPSPYVPNCELRLNIHPLVEIKTVSLPSKIKRNHFCSFNLNWFHKKFLKLTKRLTSVLTKKLSYLSAFYHRRSTKKQTSTFHSRSENHSSQTIRYPQTKNLIQIWNHLYSTLKLGAKFAVFSTFIFAIGFLALNYQAYFQIMGAWWEEQIAVSPSQYQTDLTTLITPFEPAPVLLKINKNPNIEKTRIPSINLSITPPDNRLIISRLDKSIPIVNTSAPPYDENWKEFSEKILSDLQNGVVRYPGTATPGQKGNVFITGHSSYYPWDPGQYKDVFARLNNLQDDDLVTIYYQQQRYNYQVIEKKEVRPDALDVLQQTDDYRLSLMTCTPVGTDLKRLVVIAKQL